MSIMLNSNPGTNHYLLLLTGWLFLLNETMGGFDGVHTPVWQITSQSCLLPTVPGLLTLTSNPEALSLCS